MMTTVSLIVLLGASALLAAAIVMLPRGNQSLRELVNARSAQPEDPAIRSSTGEPTSLLRNLEERLYQSKGISARPPALVVGIPIGLAIIGFVLVVLDRESLGALGFVLILLGPAAVYLDSSRRSAARKKAFAETLPQFLLTTASAMSAGLTLEQALRELSVGVTTAAEEEFHRAIQATVLGESLEAALGEMAQRMDSPDIRILQKATAIGRETGSSLTPILETVAESSLERAQVRREIGTLTAEGLMSAYVVIALPFLVFIFLLLSQPDYVSVLWTRPEGIGMSVAAIVLIAGGWIWLRRLISQETASL